MLTDATAAYRAAVFSFLHSETFHAAASTDFGTGAGSGGAVQIRLTCLVPAGVELLRCLVYGSGCSGNPYRLCEVLASACCVLPAPDHFVQQLSARDSGTAVYMKKYFHNVSAMHSKLSVRLLRAKGAVDEELLRCRSAGSQSGPELLLRRVCVGDLSVWAVSHARRLLDRLYIQLRQLSVHAEALDTEAAVGGGGSDRSLGRAEMLSLAEAVMLNAEYLAECIDKIEPVR